MTPCLREIAPLHLTARQSPVNMPFDAHSPSSFMVPPGTLEFPVLKGINSLLLPLGCGPPWVYHDLFLGMPSSERHHSPANPSTDRAAWAEAEVREALTQRRGRRVLQEEVTHEWKPG